LPAKHVSRVECLRDLPPPYPPPRAGEGREGAALGLAKRSIQPMGERPLILFPAIDLKDGLCVRLEQGDMSRATVVNRDAVSQALAFEAHGFEYLHVVDLDGAFAGRPVNELAIERILESVPLPVQLGGGIRDMATIAAWLEKGVDRVIIGTAAVRDPALV